VSLFILNQGTCLTLKLLMRWPRFSTSCLMLSSLASSAWSPPSSCAPPLRGGAGLRGIVPAPPPLTEPSRFCCCCCGCGGGFLAELLRGKLPLWSTRIGMKLTTGGGGSPRSVTSSPAVAAGAAAAEAAPGCEAVLALAADGGGGGGGGGDDICLTSP
jgi:hypothetical protein